MVGMLVGGSARHAGGGADKSLEEAKALSQKAVEQYQAGRYQEALPLSQRASGN
jgi:hypothetical protein